MDGTQYTDTYRAHTVVEGSIIDTAAGFESAEAAARWCKGQLRKNPNLSSAAYVICRDDARWTQVTR